MGRTHTKTVVVVEVVDIVLVADSAAGVPLIVVEGTAAQRTAFDRSAPPPEGGLGIIAQTFKFKTSEFLKNSEVLTEALKFFRLRRRADSQPIAE